MFCAFKTKTIKNTMQENPSQTTQILLYLKAGNKITPIGALNLFGSFRLGARIHNIKAMGFKIGMKLITTHTGKVVAEYELLKTYKQGNLFD